MSKSNIPVGLDFHFLTIAILQSMLVLQSQAWHSAGHDVHCGQKYKVQNVLCYKIVGVHTSKYDIKTCHCKPF